MWEGISALEAQVLMEVMSAISLELMTLKRLILILAISQPETHTLMVVGLRSILMQLITSLSVKRVLTTAMQGRKNLT